ncbi:hypothetical protein SPRG_16109 [Saprolegnia parasitica CBS 223.65]|uniref:F-box domain-containing protein n=1 Tax=Saprolegnia parasitica (strain CBS 223.65) TaxID=695850 RepID=A0A067BVA0_SAPPC|nr:hypothetical protein SPRG_16109 [Saprolegnia parasitica CBS 223.65]KDO18557.1 hypothetical protein SPRG_16109 [Saprolegnia parasitica CBS 223.65]|eukprot:XP_012210727.1 hypothetical protein SPRG_16109 [Saprolegnia parasitica CBS 223.65]
MDHPVATRPRFAPISVGHAGVLVHIVQCLSSAEDVLSLLDALPRHTLDAPLAALYTLLTTPKTYRVVDWYWPRACIAAFTSRHFPTLLAALPIFRSISMKFRRELDAVLRNATSESTTIPHAATIAFVSKWGHKIKSIVVKLRLLPDAMDAFPRLVRLCTGLDSIVVYVDKSHPAFVAATIRAAQHTKRMSLVSYKANGYKSGDLQPLLAAWLASGHATHLYLKNIACHVSVGLARAIAAATSLASFKLDNAPGLLQGLVEAAIPLKALNALRLTLHEDETFAEPFLTNWIDLSALRTLEVLSVNDLDLTYVLALLPHLLTLEELTLNFCVLHAVPALHAAPAPSNLRTLNVSYCHMNDETCLSLLAWASQSPCLETITLNMCRTVRSKPELFGRYLRRWILSGVSHVVLDRCVLDEENIIAIATALRHSSRSAPFTLSLDLDGFDLESYRTLLEALATCTGVGLHGHGSTLTNADERVQIEHWVWELDLRYDKRDFVLLFYSPS